MEQGMILVAADVKCHRKLKRISYLNPMQRRILKIVSFPVLYGCQAVTNLYSSILALSAAEASIQKMS